MAATPPAAGLPAEVQAMINISLGGIVVSTFFSFLTMGIILTCAWTYFEKYPKDPWAFKVLVSLCMAMSIGDTVGTGLWCYDWAVAAVLHKSPSDTQSYVGDFAAIDRSRKHVPIASYSLISALAADIFGDGLCGVKCHLKRENQ